MSATVCIQLVQIDIAMFLLPEISHLSNGSHSKIVQAGCLCSQTCAFSVMVASLLVIIKPRALGQAP